jgi:hypothetical protein
VTPFSPDVTLFDVHVTLHVTPAVACWRTTQEGMPNVRTVVKTTEERKRMLEELVGLDSRT